MWPKFGTQSWDSLASIEERHELGSFAGVDLELGAISVGQIPIQRWDVVKDKQRSHQQGNGERPDRGCQNGPSREHQAVAKIVDMHGIRKQPPRVAAPL